MTTEQLAELKRIALERLAEAERAVHSYARECGGFRRIEAFDAYKKIRLAKQLCR